MVSDEDLLNGGPHSIDEGTKICNYTATNHDQIQRNLLKKMNREELEGNEIEY